MRDFELCPLCGKRIESHYMENHHYIPESKGGTIKDTVRICGTCHDVVHFFIDLDDISKYRTVESLAAHELVGRYVQWVQDKNNTGHWKVKKVLHVMAS